MSAAAVLKAKLSDWRERLTLTTATMRAMSLQTDPQEMRRIYLDRMRQLRPLDGSVSLSRRGLKAPLVRVTRSTRWTEDLNPWKEPHRLPLVSGGLLADLIYADEPRLFDNLYVPADDPAAEYLSDYRSVAVIPLYDQGEALNMALLMRHEPGAFDPEDLPDLVSMSNLFGRATHNLVLMGQLKEAYEAADYELKVVADIQRSLLPRKPPQIPTMAIAAYYQTAHRAGGDYYDFFPLPDNKWGILVADVSGHGTPAAVLMAVTHSLAHTYQGPPMPPGEMLNHVNDHLTRLYTADSDTFVTAFYGVYDPTDRTLTYASAGHNPPRLKRCADGSLAELNGARGLPLGISPLERYHEQRHVLTPGDQLVFYTDGITEAEGPSGEQFGTERLDHVLEECSATVSDLLQAVLGAVNGFTAGRPASDDRTLLVAKIS